MTEQNQELISQRESLIISGDQSTKDQEPFSVVGRAQHGTGVSGVNSTEEQYPRPPSYSEIPHTYPIASYMQCNHMGDSQPYPHGYYDSANYNVYGEPQSSRFGLIRGYHRQMYEPSSQPRQCSECCDCSNLKPSRPGSQDSQPYNWGVICGCVMLILGVLALVMGFLLPQQSPDTRESLTPEERKDVERIDLFVDIFVISGLSILSVGGLVISAGLLVPLFRRNREPYGEEPFKFYGNEVYVKEEEFEPSAKSGNPMAMVNFGFHKDVVPTDVTLRKVQPEGQRMEPIDLGANLTNR